MGSVSRTASSTVANWPVARSLIGLRPVFVVASGALRTTTLIESLVTPWYVAPPLFAPLGHGFTHGTQPAYTNRMRPRSLSHSGPLSAALVPTPLFRAAAPASTAVSAVSRKMATSAHAPRRVRRANGVVVCDMVVPPIGLVAQLPGKRRAIAACHASSVQIGQTSP